MISKTDVPYIPADLWRKIALNDPRVCVKLSATNKEMRHALADLTTLTRNLVQPEMEKNNYSAAMYSAQNAKKSAFKCKNFFKVSDIPIVSEIRDDIRAIHTGDQSAGAVMWIPHLIMFPVLMPAKLIGRTVIAAQKRSDAKATIKRLRRAVPKHMNNIIANSAAWKQAQKDACLTGVAVGISCTHGAPKAR